MVFAKISQSILTNFKLTRCGGYLSATRSKSSSSPKSSSFNMAPIQATVSDDGQTIVCWHPENLSHVKYEFTKPLPKPHEVDSVIKTEVHDQIKQIIYDKDISEEDLIRLAYRPRPLWRRNTREIKRHLYRKDEPLDRIGI